MEKLELSSLLKAEPEQTSPVSKLFKDAYENPGTTALVVGAVAGAALGGRALMSRLASRGSSLAAETLAPNVFYIESKIAGVAADKSLNQGTGFLVSQQGHIATAFHVVKDAAEISVFTRDGMNHAAKLVAFDIPHDLAVIALKDSSVSAASAPVRLASAPLSTRVLALGHPNCSEAQVLSTGKFVTERAITGLEARCFQRPEIEGAMQLVLKMEVKPGYSGAPLADLKGRVFGVVTEGLEGKASAHGVPASVLADLMKKHGIKGH